MFIMVLPLVCETPYMLSVWLTIVPPHTVIFVQLSLILGIFDCIGFLLTRLVWRLVEYAYIP